MKSNYPKNWKNQAIKSICTVQTGKKDANHAEKDGKYKFFTCADKPQMANTYSFYGKSILLPGNGANVGKVYFYDGKFEAYQRTYVINEIEIIAKYLFYYFKNIWSQEVIGKQYGSATNYIRLGNITDLDIPVPPINEQNRIVDKIEELFSKIDDGIRSLKKVKKQLSRYRQSVLKAAVKGKLTKEWRAEQNNSLEPADQLLERILEERRERWEKQYRQKYKDKGKELPSGWKSRYSEPESVDTDELAELPKGWKWITVEQLADVETGATPLRGNSEYWENGTIPWVTSSVVNQKVVESADEYTTKKALAETNIKYFPLGTLVMAMYGEGKTRGMFTELKIEATTNQACAGIITEKTGSTVKPFLKLFLRYNYERIRLKASGGVQPNLNLGIIRSIELPLPPLEEQKEIIARVERLLSVIGNNEEVAAKELKRAKNFKSSILKKAFQGELVPQDPEDEPASELLQRINNEQEKIPS